MLCFLRPQKYINRERKTNPSSSLRINAFSQPTKDKNLINKAFKTHNKHRPTLFSKHPLGNRHFPLSLPIPVCKINRTTLVRTRKNVSQGKNIIFSAHFPDFLNHKTNHYWRHKRKISPKMGIAERNKPPYLCTVNF